MRQNLLIPRELAGDAWRLVADGPRVWPRHTHVELEVNLILSGTGRYLVGDQRVDLSPGMMVWLFPDQDHVLIDESPGYTMWIGVFRPTLMHRICRLPSNRPLILPGSDRIEARRIDHLTRERLDQLFGDVARIRSDTDHFNAGLAYLALACWDAHRHGDTTAIGHEVHPSVERAARLLRDDPGGYDLKTLARKCGLSSSRLSRLFHQQTEMRLADYRNRQRVARFIALYGAGRRHTLIEAALAAGFGSYAQFYRVFREITGKSPLDHRRERQIGSSGAGPSGAD